MCQCHRPHVQLRGYSKQHRTSWTKAAESYPTSLCRFLALVTAEGLKPVARRMRFDPAACARNSSRRVGEAANPGPRTAMRRGDVDIEDVRLVQPATMMVQAKVHERFCSWLAGNLGSGAIRSIQQVPSLQVMFLRSYGVHLYNSGEPMYLFRHLVVYLQQMFPAEKPRVQPAWELLAKCELLQPTTHRPPMPKKLLDAMVGLARSWGWLRVYESGRAFASSSKRPVAARIKKLI